MKYRSANEYYKEVFGTKMYKASISLDVTCPNRDGRCGTGGCTFCSAGGSGEFSTDRRLGISEQVSGAISRLSSKTNSDTGFIAYFQSFTNTYCSPAYLRGSIDEAIRNPRIRAVSIATRPDCLPDEILDVLRDVNRIIPVFVELGLQTSNDSTAELINRCYKTEVYREALSKLSQIGINVITHIIFGLPGETIDDMLNTVRYSIESGTNGIKFTCLYALEGTKIGELYRAGQLKLLEQDEYFDIVERALELLPDDIVVHRLTGDGPKKLLIGPMWTANKRMVVNYINKRFGK